MPDRKTSFGGGSYSVCQFFSETQYEYVRQYVSVKEAVDAFEHYTNNVTVALGITERVVITDGGDRVVAEWNKGKGLVFPPID